MTKPLNVNEPVQTRDGRKARIICADRKGEYPIIALIEEMHGPENVCSFHSDGKLNADYPSSHDLINVPKRITGWVNVYGSEMGLIYSTKEKADRAAFDRIRRTACLYVDFAEGEGL